MEEWKSTGKIAGGRRIGYIDSMKGFAALMVVIGHVASNFFDSGLYPEIRLLEFIVFMVANSFHMAFFMTISGYIYHEAYIDEIDGVRKERLQRQVVDMFAVYIMFSVFYGTMRAVFSRFSVSKDSILDVLLVLVRPLGPYWYLYALLILYVFCAATKIHTKNRRILLCLLLIVAALSSYINIEWFFLSGLLYYFLFFYVGVAYKRYPGWIIGKGWLTAAMSLLATVLLVILAYRAISNGMVRDMAPHYIPVARLVIASGLDLGLWWIFKNLRFFRENRLLRFIGRYSLEIYVLHCILVVLFKVALPFVGITNGLINMSLTFSLSVIIPIVFAIVLKKLDIHKYLFRPISTLFLSENRAEK